MCWSKWPKAWLGKRLSESRRNSITKEAIAEAVQLQNTNGFEKYPLRGMDFTYIDPTEPVAVEDWEALNEPAKTHFRAPENLP